MAVTRVCDAGPGDTAGVLHRINKSAAVSAQMFSWAGLEKAESFAAAQMPSFQLTLEHARLQKQKGLIFCNKNTLVDIKRKSSAQNIWC